MHTARRAYILHHGILVLYLTYVHAAWHAHIRPSRRAMGTLANPAKSGSWDARPGPITGMGWDAALHGHPSCIYLNPQHPTSHVTSRACTHDAHFMPCCMRCLHALRGRPVQARIAPPRAPGRFSSRICVYVQPRWPVTPVESDNIGQHRPSCRTGHGAHGGEGGRRPWPKRVCGVTRMVPPVPLAPRAMGK